MLYVDVILPLSLEGTFTYSVPDTLAPQVRMGVRVVVPLGRSKTYTAMAVRTHNDKPEFDTRDILQVVDDSPVLPERQLRTLCNPLHACRAEPLLSDIRDGPECC